MEEEISLREIIEVLLNWKWVIVAVTALAVLLSGFYSFFILQPIYEAQTVINVRLQSGETKDDFIDMVEAMSLERVFNLETYQVQIRTHALMEQVIQELDLNYNADRLSRSIKVDRIGNTTMLNISYTNSNPEVAASVINTLTEKFLNFISEKKVEEIAVSTGFILEQKDLTEGHLDDALNELKLFLQEPNNVTEMDAEINAKIKLLTDYKSSIITTGVDLAASIKERDSLKRQLAATPALLTTKKSVATDPYVQSLLAGLTGDSIVEISSLEFISQEINPVHINLSQQLANINTVIDKQREKINQIESTIDVLEEELESLQVVYAEKKITHDEMQRQVDIHKKNLLALTDRYTAARMTESIEAGRLTMSIISPAIPPINPIGPNKMLNMAIAAVLGLMASVFGAFFAHYWKTSGKEQGLQESKSV